MLKIYSCYVAQHRILKTKCEMIHFFIIWKEKRPGCLFSFFELQQKSKQTNLVFCIWFLVTGWSNSWVLLLCPYFELLRKNMNWKSTTIWRNKWRYIIWRSRKTELMKKNLVQFFSIVLRPYCVAVLSLLIYHYVLPKLVPKLLSSRP